MGMLLFLDLNKAFNAHTHTWNKFRASLLWIRYTYLAPFSEILLVKHAITHMWKMSWLTTSKSIRIHLCPKIVGSQNQAGPESIKFIFLFYPPPRGSGPQTWSRKGPQEEAYRGPAGHRRSLSAGGQTFCSKALKILQCGRYGNRRTGWQQIWRKRQTLCGSSFSLGGACGDFAHMHSGKSPWGSFACYGSHLQDIPLYPDSWHFFTDACPLPTKCFCSRLDGSHSLLEFSDSSLGRKKNQEKVKF